MDVCYRSTPKSVGAFFESLYQDPLTMMGIVVTISIVAGFVWYKSRHHV